MHISIAYEFDLNQKRINRNAYNLLDWLGDLGGLKEAVVIVFSFIIGVVNYRNFEDSMVSHLYRVQPQQLNHGSSSVGTEHLTINDTREIGVKADRANCFRKRV